MIEIAVYCGHCHETWYHTADPELAELTGDRDDGGRPLFRMDLCGDCRHIIDLMDRKEAETGHAFAWYPDGHADRVPLN